MQENTSAVFGTLLKQHRKRRQLTQQQLAETLGIHRNTIGRWEEGSFLPESKAVVLDLARSLHLNEQESRQLLEASLASPVPLWSVPYARYPLFTGREAILSRLYAHLRMNTHESLPRASALYGLGGIGKTQVALEYAYRYGLEYRAVFWIGAQTAEQIHISLLRIATCLDLPERAEADQQRVIAAVQRWLERHGEWLMIWDNLEDLELLRRYQPANRQGSLLFTTRRPSLGTLAEPLELPPFNEEEGTTLLLRRSRYLNDVTQKSSLDSSVLESTEALVRLLEGLPLALDQAGAYIEETGCGLTRYLQRYQEQRRQLLAFRGAENDTHPNSVATTIHLAIEQVEQRVPAATDLLRLCAFLCPEAIPEDLLAAGAAHLGSMLGSVIADPFQFDLVVAALRNVSLIARHAPTEMLALHRLVQVVLQDWMTLEEVHLWQRRVIRMLNAAFPDGTPDTWEKCERFLTQALVAVSLMEEVGSDFRESSELLCKVSNYLSARGREEKAAQLREQANRSAANRPQTRHFATRCPID